MKFKYILNRTALNKAKLSVLSASVTALICSSTYSSDIDIYKAPAASSGSTTVMMMLDVSGSMRVTHPTADVAWKACDVGYVRWQSPRYTTQTRRVNVDGKSVSYTRYICNEGNKADRITRLKDAIVTLMLGDADNNIDALDDKVVLGISTLGAVREGGTTTKNGGSILVAARKLNESVNDGGVVKTQRRLILEKVLGINPIAGTPTANSYAETIAYLMGKSTSNHTNSGWSFSTGTGIKERNSYKQPESISSQVNESDETKQCNAQGIYVLTDGDPNNGVTGAQKLAKDAFSPNTFSCSESGAAWDCIYKMNNSLLDATKNPAKMKFITAIVGFGSDFNTIPSSVQTEEGVSEYSGEVSTNVKNAAIWGIRGEGGWYSGDSTEDVVNSFTQFLKKVKTDIPGVSTGNATLPIDALNSSAIQPYGYFPQFVPKVATDQTQQTWYGNLKKYYAVKGSLYGNKNGTNPVMQKDEIKNIVDLWSNSAYVTSSNEVAFKDGVLSNLLQGYVESRSPKERLLLTDFSYKNKEIKQNLNLSWFDDADQKVKFNAISSEYNLDEEAPYRQALMNLLGFENAVAGQNLTKATVSGKVPQIGAILHSKPILLTQSGLPEVTGTATSAVIDTKNRDDYILFGSTQGVLHVVDADGKEVFAFVPKEMIENQNQAFAFDGGADTGGKNKLYYGIDGEWTAHTVYVSDLTGRLTVNGGSRTIQNDDGKEQTINLQGKQWIYGGLRMGGRSYYSLDLTNIRSPKVKFQIDPNNKQVHYLDGSTTKSKAIEELKFMGQSWSKPTLAYVNWFGTRKLVMIVGGGYDAGSTDGLTADGDGIYTTKTVNGRLIKDKRNGYAGYENADYVQKNKIGAGVYMFDADNGDLLWSVSGNNSTTTTQQKTNLKLSGVSANMNYSVVSNIKTVDRNNDGLVDHLYFGDLNGQAFRVDFAPTDTAFNSQVNKILDLSATHKRFYSAPTFTIHSQGTAVVSFASGNKSQPLHGHTTNALATEDYDGVFAVYDYDAYANLFPISAFQTRSLGNSTTTAISQLKQIENRVDSSDSVSNAKRPKINSTTGNGGWYYLYSKEEALNATNGAAVTTNKGKQILKTLGSLVAIEGDLYVPVFDSSKAGTTGSCSAGVAGETALQRFCLPYGICKENIYLQLGAGIGEPIIGGGRDGDPNKRSIFILNEDKKDGPPNIGGDNTQIINYGGALKFIPNRWYEQYALGGG
ncbi:hypothetical protein [Acinetobacter sp. Marseille-Q1618]|uniref:hypothetical protein n=1 Tax=Acinetobacter sp. Marseille-Q1618 TaxID=2697502 RepID=UPI00156D84EE|nr:hypothetical protein [Acinetobacter sp. Marseille-Q1618]